MACNRVLSNRFLRLALLAETAPCTFKAGEHQEYALTDAAEGPEGTTVVSATRAPYDQPAQTAARWASPTLSAELRILHLAEFWEWLFNSPWPGSEVTVIGTANIDMVTGATHQDGSTGWAIQAPTGTFTSVISMDAAFAGGLVWSSGWTNPENNRPRRIKVAWNTGAVDQLDIWDEYTQGGAGGFGEAPVAEAAASSTLDFGQIIRDKVPTAANQVRLSGVGQWADAPDYWASLVGILVGSVELAWTGVETVNMNVGLMAQEVGERTTTPRGGSTIAQATGFDDPYVLANGIGLQYFVVGGHRSIHGATLGGSTITLTRNMATNPISGRSDRGTVSPQTLSATISADVFNEGAALTLYLDGLCEGLGEDNQAPIDILLRDPDGNELALFFPRACFNPTERASTFAGTEPGTGTLAPVAAGFEPYGTVVLSLKTA